VFTHVSVKHIYSLVAEAKKRGYNPEVCKIVEVAHVEDAKRSGRPKTSPIVVKEVLAILTRNASTENGPHGESQTSSTLFLALKACALSVSTKRKSSCIM